MKKYPPRRSEIHDPLLEVPRPIFGIDIDGTLGLYHEHFTRFAEAWTGRSLPGVEGYREGSFAAHLGLSKSTYRKIKLAYRRGGAKRSMPVVAGASALTGSLRSRGAVVVLCTTRPYLSLEGVDEDTRHWARRNGVAYDFIIWGENKYRDLARFGDRVVATLDDEPLLMQQSKDSGLLTFGVIRPYNLSTDVAPEEWCRNLEDAGNDLHVALDYWEKEHR